MMSMLTADTVTRHMRTLVTTVCNPFATETIANNAPKLKRESKKPTKRYVYRSDQSIKRARLLTLINFVFVVIFPMGYLAGLTIQTTSITSGRV
jgi:hypothetical protein